MIASTLALFLLSLALLYAATGVFHRGWQLPQVHLRAARAPSATATASAPVAADAAATNNTAGTASEAV